MQPSSLCNLVVDTVWLLAILLVRLGILILKSSSIVEQVFIPIHKYVI